MPARTQLSLFLEPAADIERARAEFNPLQHALIACHVTLCREDEIEPQWERVLFNLENLRAAPLTVQLGPPARFDEGRGVLLPAEGDNEAFQQLRAAVLHGVIEAPRRHQPHITLLHPRNATCTDEIFERIGGLQFPRFVVFHAISWIRQMETDAPWVELRRFELNGAGPLFYKNSPKVS